MIKENLLDKKLIDYLKTYQDNTKIGLIFKHGVGDIIMFLPYFDYIKSMYKNLIIDLFILRDREKFLFEKRNDLVRIHNDDSLNDEIYKKYDYIFELEFREGNPTEVFIEGKSKPYFCWTEEIGLNQVIENKIVNLQNHKSKYIGFTFNRVGKHFTNASNIPYNFAKYLWFKTKELGFIPIEILFLHPDYEVGESSRMYDFIDRTTRDLFPNFENVLSILNTLNGYVTLDCGLFHISYNYFNHKNILFLQNTAPINYLTSFHDIPNFDFIHGEKFSENKFINWLKNCDGKKINE